MFQALLKFGQAAISSLSHFGTIAVTGVVVTVAGGALSLYAPEEEIISEDLSPAAQAELLDERDASPRVPAFARPANFAYAESFEESGMPADYANRTAVQDHSEVPPSENSSVQSEGRAIVSSPPIFPHSLSDSPDPEASSASSSKTSSTSGGGGSFARAAPATSPEAPAEKPRYTPIDSSPRSFELRTALEAWAGVCQEARVQLYDANRSPTFANKLLTITLSSEEGGIFLDPACELGAETISVHVNRSAAAFYIKSKTAAKFKAREPGLGEREVSVAILSPTADRVAGQKDFATGSPNTGGLSANTLNGPTSIAHAGNKLIVADQLNHRILIWNELPKENGQPADLVLGQPDVTSNTPNFGGLSARSLQFPAHVFTDGKTLFVADKGNNRVLVWTSIPTTSHAPADLVLGQNDFQTNAENHGGLSASTLAQPECVQFDGERLLVCDSRNDRVLLWSSMPTAHGAPASVVVGQPDFTTHAAGTSGSLLLNPTRAIFTPTKLFVSDTGNHRVLVWNFIPQSNGAVADWALGQADLLSRTENHGGLSGSSLSSPSDLGFDSQGRLFLADRGNHRVLVFNRAPVSFGAEANGVIGQKDLASNDALSARGATTLRDPGGISVYGPDLWVSEPSEHRVLRFSPP